MEAVFHKILRQMRCKSRLEALEDVHCKGQHWNYPGNQGKIHVQLYKIWLWENLQIMLCSITTIITRIESVLFWIWEERDLLFYVWVVQLSFCNDQKCDMSALPLMQPCRHPLRRTRPWAFPSCAIRVPGMEFIVARSRIGSMQV